MKKIVLSLLLIVSSLASLTACDSTSKIKKYSNKVEATTFAEKLGEEYSKKEEIFDLFLNDCKVGYDSEVKANLKVRKNNVNKTLKGTFRSKYAEKGLYDVDKNTTIYTNKYNVKSKNLSNSSSDEISNVRMRTNRNQEEYYCIYNDKYYELDLNAKKALSSSENLIKSQMSYLFPRITKYDSYSNLEYYIDDNIYTITGETYDAVVTIQYTFTERDFIKTSLFTKEYENEDEKSKVNYEYSYITTEYMKFEKVNNKSYPISKYIKE